MQLIKNASAEKLRGGFYTPEEIASFMLRWAINGDKDLDILEPSCGDGVFLEQIKKGNYIYKSITAIELDPLESKKANKIDLINCKVINGDFHVFFNTTNKTFNAIVGNPPYIRYQYFNRTQQIEAAKIFQRADLKYTKLANSWVSFLVGSSMLLKEMGRMGFVIPAEILQVTYAEQLRKYLAKFFNKINIISFEKLVFKDIQQEVILLLCEKNLSKKHQIEHIELKDASALRKLNISALRSPSKKISHEAHKWTFYFLDQYEIDFIEEIMQSNISLIKDFAKVEVGITTGCNSFFSITKKVMEEFELAEFARPLVGRSVQANGVIFTDTDWKENCNLGAKSYLLVFPEKKLLKKYKGALNYIKRGELNKINSGYKTGIRDDWFVIPSLRVSNALFIRRNNRFPKLIINHAGALTTDTMHRVNIKPGINQNDFASSYYNSLSFAFSEIVGRSYGGGVLELMPKEVESIILPFKKGNSFLLLEIDEMLRKKESISSILSYTNKIILKDGFGFSKQDINIANKIWEKLSSRRLNRAKNV